MNPTISATARGLSAWQLDNRRLDAFAIAALCVVVLMIAIAVAAKNPGSRRGFLGQLVDGADGRLSTSKFSSFVWTFVAIFGFIEVFVERLLLGISTTDTTMPVNLLVAMGFSAVTLTAAKGITVAYSARGIVDKSAPAAAEDPAAAAAPKPPAATGGLVTQDDGSPDIAKIQLIAFTVIGLAVYLVRMALLDSAQPQMVDIDSSLMVLMGLSHGAYLGKKLTTTAAPRLTGLRPPSGLVGEKVSVTGNNLGSEQGDSTITVDGIGVEVAADTWSNTGFTFVWPEHGPAGKPWRPGDRGTPVVLINGYEARSPMSFTVIERPRLKDVEPKTGPAGTVVTLVGTGFGDTQDDSVVEIEGLAVPVATWSNDAIRFVWPASHAGAAWKRNETASIALKVHDRKAASTAFTVQSGDAP